MKLIERGVPSSRKPLGAQTVGLKAGNPLEGMGADEAEALMIEMLKAAAPHAHARKVYLAVENGGTSHAPTL